MRAVAALYVQSRGFRAERAGSDDDTWYTDKVGDIGGCEASDGGLGDGGVHEELVLRQAISEVCVIFAS